jgi:hypothetical protein
MKLNKIFAAALAILTMTACDDDDPVNTADVTVNMQQTQMSIAEDFSTGVYYYVPVVLSGETNGPVTVTIAVEGTGANPAVEDRDYMVTSKTIVIPAGETQGSFEFHPSSNDDINDDRQFIFTIVSATGAKIGNNTSTLVTLLDEDHLLPEALSKLVGTWQSTSASGTYNCTISAFPEDDKNHLKQVKLSGIGGLSFANDVILDFSLDASTGLVNLSLSMPQILGEKIAYNPPVGEVDVVLLPFDGGLYLQGVASATSNEEVTQFVFDCGWAAGLFTPGNHTAGGFTGYTGGRAQDFTLTKVQ